MKKLISSLMFFALLGFFTPQVPAHADICDELGPIIGPLLGCLEKPKPAPIKPSGKTTFDSDGNPQKSETTTYLK